MIVQFEEYRSKKRKFAGDRSMPIHGYVREVLYSGNYERLRYELDSTRRRLARIMNSSEAEVSTKTNEYGYTEEQIIRNELLLLEEEVAPLESERKEFLQKLKKSYERAAKRFNLTVSQVVYEYEGMKILESRCQNGDYEILLKFETASKNLFRKRFSKWSVHNDISEWVRELEQAS